MEAVAIVQDRDGKALAGQVFAQEVAQFGIVVDDEDLGRLVRSHSHMIVRPAAPHGDLPRPFCFRRLHPAPS
ncbi:hypothetical protein D3C81_1763660 [compost metagenome]